MMDSLRQYLEVSNEDADQRRRGALLNILLVGVFIIDILAIILVGSLLIIRIPGYEVLTLTFWSAIVFIVGIGAVYYINRSGRVIIAGTIFLAILTLAFIIPDVRAVGRGDTLFYFVVPVLISAVIIRPYASFIMAGINSLIFVAVALALNLEPNFYISSLGMFAIALISWISARNLENALQEVRTINVELDERVALRTQELAEANVQLEKQTHELEEANRQLTELDKLKSKFVSDVSHEFRTPINNISIYLEMLEEGSPEKSKQYRAVLREETERLEKLVSDVLDLSRLESSEIEASIDWIDLNDIVGRVIDANQLRADAKGLEMSFAAADALPLILAESNQLTLAINNLIGNAINYTSDGYVKASTAYDADVSHVKFTVSDSGIGIPEEDLPLLFERFYRGQQAGQSTIPGTGLGLSITREIVEQFGGSIEVDSQVGSGSTFSIIFPTKGDD